MMTSPEIRKYRGYVHDIEDEINTEWDDEGGACDAINLATIYYRGSLEEHLRDHGFATYEATDAALRHRIRTKGGHPAVLRHLMAYVHDDERFYIDNMYFYLGDGIEHLRALERGELVRAFAELATDELDAMEHCVGYVTADDCFAG